jgi:GNAT superfamily N-acetyltransferase
LNLTDFSFNELNSEIYLTAFDCGDNDINEFLKQEALDYQKEKLSNTYIFSGTDGGIAAFFSISNDCLIDLGEDEGYTNNKSNRFHRKTDMPNSKRIRQYPAIKIGRLGTDKKYHRTGLADQLMDFIKGWAPHRHRPACRLLLLDAYNKERQLKY